MQDEDGKMPGKEPGRERQGRWCDLSGAKKTLELDQYEYGVIFHSLKDKRNQMIQENRATDAVDDVLLKVIHAMEPSGKEKRRQKHHEER